MYEVINLDTLKHLRERTGLPIMDVKKGLMIFDRNIEVFKIAASCGWRVHHRCMLI